MKLSEILGWDKEMENRWYRASGQEEEIYANKFGQP